MTAAGGRPQAIVVTSELADVSPRAGFVPSGLRQPCPGAQPRLSVVVAMTDRDAHTDRAVASLAAACARFDVQFILVGASSLDDIESPGGRWPTASIIVESPDSPVGELRAIGMARATGDVVLLTGHVGADAPRLVARIEQRCPRDEVRLEPVVAADALITDLTPDDVALVLDDVPIRPVSTPAGSPQPRGRAEQALQIRMVTTFYPPYNFGGDGIAIQRLARALVRRGHDVSVVHDADAYVALAGAEPPARVGDDGVEVISLRSALGAVSPFLTHQTGRPVVHGARLGEILDRGTDVTFFHNVSLVGGPALLRKGRGVTLYEAHEHWLVCPTHVLWRHDRERCDGKECVRCSIAHRRPPQLWRWTGQLERDIANVDAFIAKSEFSRAKHREFGFTRNMEVIPYFLPDSDAAAAGPSAARPSPNARPYFLFVGRLERIKGLDDVIPAFRGSDGPELLIAGDGEHAPTLRSLAVDLPRVHFLGRVSPEQLASYYANAVALIVPSICYETFGIILIEAFKQGTPVIARRLGPFPEIVEAAGGGMLFDTIEQLHHAMQTMVCDREQRDAFAESARRAFAERWSERVVVPQYLDLIRRVAAEKGDHRIAEALAPEEGE